MRPEKRPDATGKAPSRGSINASFSKLSQFHRIPLRARNILAKPAGTAGRSTRLCVDEATSAIRCYEVSSYLHPYPLGQSQKNI